jgi:hypothetical protein
MGSGWRFKIKDSDINHLRRLLGYVRCEIGQSPEEFMETMRKIAPVCGEPDEGGKQRLVESYQQSKRVPKYVRAAVKALEKIVAEEEGEVVETQSAPKPFFTEAERLRILCSCNPELESGFCSVHGFYGTRLIEGSIK